jgi:hypothetical protein
MNSSLQDAIKEAFAIAPTNRVVLDTLEIRQTGVQDPIFLVKSMRAISAVDENGETHVFEPVGFQFTLPPSTDEGFQSLNIAIDNVGRRVVDFVETAMSNDEPIKVIYRPYISDDLSQPQMDPPLVLYLKDVSISATQVVGRATFADIVNKKFPSQLYIRERFPSLG